jgi:mycothiol maleylpyruvate isomerase-like protein
MPEQRVSAASHRPGVVIERSREADAFLSAVGDAAPEAVSACDGWTTHEVAAHVTGIAVEVIRHLEPYLQGDPVPRTRSFEERETPLQATGRAALLSRLVAEEERMRRLAGDVLGREPDAAQTAAVGSAATSPSPTSPACRCCCPVTEPALPPVKASSHGRRATASAGPIP